MILLYGEFRDILDHNIFFSIETSIEAILFNVDAKDSMCYNISDIYQCNSSNKFTLVVKYLTSI